MEDVFRFNSHSLSTQDAMQLQCLQVDNIVVRAMDSVIIRQEERTQEMPFCKIILGASQLHGRKRVPQHDTGFTHRYMITFPAITAIDAAMFLAQPATGNWPH
jgi:hypothetical protein